MRTSHNHPWDDPKRERHLRGSWQRFFAVALVVVALPSYAAEPTRVVRVGYVSPLSPSTEMGGAGTLWERLHELGYVDGRNLIVEQRWAEGRIELPRFYNRYARVCRRSPGRDDSSVLAAALINVQLGGWG